VIPVGESAADAMQKSHPSIKLREVTQRLRRAVRRVVVDEHNFPLKPGQTLI
jgi:hypothetical protein